MFISCFVLSAHADEATWDSDCDLGKGYDVILQSCKPRAFTWNEVDCTDPDRDSSTYCVESSPSLATQTDKETTVSSTYTLDTMLSSLTEISGEGYGVKMSASVNYVSKNYESAHSVSFYKTSTGDSYDKHVKYPERLKLNDAAKALLAKNSTMFVELYGSHYVSKVIYSNYFVASVKVSQTESESSTSLGIIAQIQAKDFFNLDAKETFDNQSTKKSETVRIETEMLYNGASKAIKGDEATDIVDGIMDQYKTWEKAINTAVTDGTYNYAKPSRFVYSSWTESEDVQYMIQAGEIDNVDILMRPNPSSVVLGYLRDDTIRSNSDLNTISNLRTWSCVAGDSELSDQLLDIADKIGTHLDAIDKIDDGMMAYLEAQVSVSNTDWFTGRSGKYIAQVNDLMDERCQGGSEESLSIKYNIKPYGNPNYKYANPLRFDEDGANAFLRGFTFTGGRLNLKQAQMRGETIGYQKITTDNQVNGGGIQKTSKGFWKYYAGGDLENTAEFDLICAKEGMYVSGIHAIFSETQCACTTPNAGKSGKNQRQCTNGRADWCPYNYCKLEKSVKETSIGSLCGGRRRSSSSGFEEVMAPTLEGIEPAGTAYGRINSMTVHCSPLPLGVYGLPSLNTTSGPYTLQNQPGKTVTADCPAGSAVWAIDWVGRARAKNGDFNTIWTIADSIKLYCRKFSDFITESVQLSSAPVHELRAFPKYATE